MLKFIQGGFEQKCKKRKKKKKKNDTKINIQSIIHYRGAKKNV